MPADGNPAAIQAGNLVHGVRHSKVSPSGDARELGLIRVAPPSEGGHFGGVTGRPAVADRPFSADADLPYEELRRMREARLSGFRGRPKSGLHRRPEERELAGHGFAPRPQAAARPLPRRGRVLIGEARWDVPVCATYAALDAQGTAVFWRDGTARTPSSPPASSRTRPRR